MLSIENPPLGTGDWPLEPPGEPLTITWQRHGLDYTLYLDGDPLAPSNWLIVGLWERPEATDDAQITVRLPVGKWTVWASQVENGRQGSVEIQA